MMTKKNLAKAVTLSVLLMMPYGMAWASEYDMAIDVDDDTYNKIYVNGKPVRTDNDNGEFIYDFGVEDVTIKNIINDRFSAIQSDNDDTNEKIIIKNKVNIDLRQGYVDWANDSLTGIEARGGVLIDRRFGGNITLNSTNAGGEGIWLLQNSKVFAGDGDIIIQRSSNESNGYDEVSGIEYWGEEGSMLVKGTGTIDVTNITKDDSMTQPTVAYGIAHDSGTAGNTLILGYQGNYSDEDLAKFTNDNLEKAVREGNLEKVTINATAEMDNGYAIAGGILWQPQNGKNADDVIATGALDITVKATSAYEYSEMYPGDPTLILTTGTMAIGLDNGFIGGNHDPNMDSLPDSMVDTIMVIKSTDIEAVATDTGNFYVNACGLNTDAFAKEYKAETTLLEKSTILATATGNTKVTATGILASDNGLGVHLRELEEAPFYEYYLKYKDGGNSSVSTSDITITTTTNGGKEVENVGIKASGADVNVNGAANITAIANALEDKENNKVYGLWSTFGGNITINGQTTISTTGGQDIAVVAGTENWTDVTAAPDGGTNIINLNYGAGSDITGDIISGYGGNITIGNADGISTLSTRNSAGTLNLSGDALSANGGKLSINLTSGSTWTGRADDYQDADSANWADKHEEQFNPKFSHDIAASGEVSVKLAQGATWNVTGQSWISVLNGNGVVDLRRQRCCTHWQGKR